MANNRGGLSKREYAAKQSGGTLNYKTGKISVPVKSSAKKTSSSSSSNKVGIATNADGTTLYSDGTSSNPYASNVGETAGSVQARYDAQQSGVLPSASKSSSKSSSSSNRSKAASVTTNYTPAVPASFNPAPTSAPKASGSGGLLSDLMTKIGQMYGNNGLAKAAPGYDNSPAQLQANLNTGLGIAPANASFADYSGAPAQVSPTQTEASGGKIPIATMIDGTTLFSDGSTSSPAASTVGEQAGSVQARTNAQGASGRTPRQTTGGGSSSNISQNFTPNIVPQNFTPAPDYTPVDNGQGGTQRQFVGNGSLSNGQFNNGQGNYGIQGAMTGTGGTQGSNPIDDLLTVLGLKPQMAQAASFDQFSPTMSQMAPQSNLSSLIGGYQNLQNQFGGTRQSTIADNQSLSQADQTPPPANDQRKITNTQPAIPTQGATGGGAQMDYYTQQNKGYSQAEKAQKKALNELIKSIKSQYGTQKKEGTANLEKSKQEDLLKLSGLFSFANQDPNSEQRIQYEQRANNDYAGQLKDFLSKISQAQSQDVSQAKQGYQGKLADIAQQRNATSLEIAKLQQAAQEAAAKRGVSNLKYQPAFDNNGNLTGTYAIDANGNTYWNPSQQPIQVKPQQQNILQSLLGGLNLTGTQPQ